MSSSCFVTRGDPMLVRETEGAFSGSDILVTALFPSAPPVVLGQATTVTYSIYRVISDVRTIGRIGVKGFAKGARTVAGTIIFTMINKHWINELKEHISYLRLIPIIRADELPPFDLVITAANEYGQSAMMILYGVTFVDEGSVMSVENLFSENQMTYKAVDIRLFDDATIGTMSPSVAFANPEVVPTYSLPSVKTTYSSPGVSGGTSGGNVTPTSPPTPTPNPVPPPVRQPTVNPYKDKGPVPW